MGKWLTWTVRVSVDRSWVEDGFDLTDERARDMLAYYLLPYANRDEIKAKVISAPSKKSIRQLQGYES